MNEFVKINKISRLFNLSNDLCFRVLHRYSTNNAVKIMSMVGDQIMVPSALIDELNRVINLLNSDLVDYQEIYSNKQTSIPIKGDGFVYYLFDDNVLMYIGQTINLAARIGEHYRLKKEFNLVAYIECEPKELLLNEALYIFRDQPKLNTSVMRDDQYLKCILERIEIGSVVDSYF